MNWKFTSLLSGAGVVATLLAAGTPSRVAPQAWRVQPGGASSAGTTSSDIEQQAARLQVRLHQEVSYLEPSRNPFRFTQSAAASPSSPSSVLAPASSPEAVTTAAPAPAAAQGITLVGIATDHLGDVPVRTAVLSTPLGVALAKVGDDLLGGQYRVSDVQDDGVDLVVAADGAVVRLPLAQPRAQ